MHETCMEDGEIDECQYQRNKNEKVRVFHTSVIGKIPDRPIPRSWLNYHGIKFGDVVHNDVNQAVVGFSMMSNDYDLMWLQGEGNIYKRISCGLENPISFYRDLPLGILYQFPIRIDLSVSAHRHILREYGISNTVKSARYSYRYNEIEAWD